MSLTKHGANILNIFQSCIKRTKEERKHPELFKYSRKQRVANGSGKTMQDINKVLKKYEQMKEMMKKMEQYRKTGKMPPGGLGGMGGMGGLGGFPGM